MKIDSWSRRFVAASVATLLACATPAAMAATTTPLLRIAGGTAGSDLGDYITDDDALNTHYRYFVEVPAGTTRLQIDIFDADFGVGGDSDTNNDRDRERGNGFNSTTNYRVFNPLGVAVATNFTTGNATGPANADNAWLQLYGVNNPAAGHWRIELDSADNTGDDVNAYGIRAHDGNAGATGRELNLYAATATMIGVNAVTGNGTRGTTFTLHPYVTSGCSANEKDFDYDNADALTVGGIPQRIVFTNRTGTWTQTVANAQLSDNAAWNNDTLTNVGANQPAGTNVQRDGMGIWTAAYRINEFEGDNANYSTIYIGDDSNTTGQPTANPQANSERIYLPTDAGTAPEKPYLRQNLFYVSGTNPPQNGQQTVMQVTVSVVNPTDYPITFSLTNLVSARVPTTGGTVYLTGNTNVSEGTVVSQPANLGNGLVTWNPGTVAANTTAQLSYRIRVTPGGTGTFAVTGAGNGTTDANTHGTRAQYRDETGNTLQAEALAVFGGLCPLQYSTGTNVPTPVTLSWLSATREGGSVRVAWTTDSEYRNVAFDVVGRSGTTWRRLGATPLASRGDAVGAEAYSATFANAADIEEVAIEDIASDGRRTRHAPVAVGAELGVRAANDPIRWPAIRAEHDAFGRGAQGTSSRAWLTVTSDGIQRVTAAQLLAAGIDLRTASRDALALYDTRGDVPIRVSGGSGATLGADGVVEFFGEASRGLYGDAHVYTLAADPARALRVRELAGNAGTGDVAATQYVAEAGRAQDNEYSFASTAKDPWYDTRMLAFDGVPQTYAFTLDLDAFAPVQSGNTVALTLWGGSDWPEVEDDHRIAIAVNGTPVATHAFPGLREELLRFELPDGTLHAGANTVTITQTADVGAAHDLIHLERVALSYGRTYRAKAGVLDTDEGPAGEAAYVSDVVFRDGYGDGATACAQYSCASVVANGFKPGAIEAWLVTRRDAARIDGVTADASGDATLLVSRASGERVYATHPSGVKTPAIRPAAEATDPSLPPAEFLVIAHPQFAGSLDAFVAARTAEGLSVRVVDTDSVYARYSAGQPDPEAIRSLLRDAYGVGTRYALLVGADHYDYRNHLGLGAVSFVPTLYASTGDIVQFAPADPLYGDVDGDDQPEVAVGRWPVRNAAELERMITKTLAYATAPHAGKALLVAGGEQADFDFGELSESLQQPLADAGWTDDTAYVDALGASGVRASIVDAINQGRALVNFVGHSSVDRWTFDPVLLGTDVPALFSNASAPTVVAQWGCWSNYFVNPQSDSIAVRLLFDDGGAAAAIGAATLVDTQQQDAFMNGFVAAAAGGARLGDALETARRQFREGHATRRDLLVGINLLGDPTLKLRR